LIVSKKKDNIIEILLLILKQHMWKKHAHEESQALTATKCLLLPIP